MSRNFKEANLIADIKSFGSNITRREYREARGHLWERTFRNFSDFKKAAFGSLKNDTKAATAATVESNEFVGDTWTISLPKTRIHTLEELLEYCEVDTSIWEVERFICNKWEVGAANKEGDVKITPLFQVKATLIKRKAIIAIRDEINSLKEDAKNYSRIPKKIYRSAVDSSGGNLLEVIIPDLHAGKLAWSKETGHKDYDTRIAAETYKRALETIIEQSKVYKFERVVFGVGNDLLNSDNLNGQTTKGTLVNTDTRYQKTYIVIRRMIVDAIERLRGIAPVSVKLVPGNHDTLGTFTLGDSLECWFHKFNDVEIDNGPSQHKSFRWGKVLVVLTHGEKGKHEDYGLWMATEFPEDFGNTKFREVHIGHKHKTMVEEKFGVRIRTLSALCPPDAWHAENKFVGNLRSAEAFVWNKEKGLVAQFFHTETD